MKLIQYFPIILLFLTGSVASAQRTKQPPMPDHLPATKITIEPGIGINPMPNTDLILSTLAQWNIKKRLSITGHTAIGINSAFNRNSFHIKTDYNFSLMQKFGVGTSLYTRKSSHTFSLMAGVKYDFYKETLDNPEFEKVEVMVNTTSPDAGLMYSLKVGQKKTFFSYRMYIPLYPYPIRKLDINAIDGNLANISMEVGVGLRL